MPKKFGKVIVSGGNFVSKYNGSNCLKKHKVRKPTYSVQRRYLRAIEISPLEDNYENTIAFLVRLENTHEILLFTDIKMLGRFLTHHQKSRFIWNKYLSFLDQYGCNFSAEWPALEKVKKSYFNEVSLIIGEIIKKEYGLKKGYNYQEYFQKAFHYNYFDETLIEEIVCAYFYQLKVRYNYIQSRKKKFNNSDKSTKVLLKRKTN